MLKIFRSPLALAGMLMLSSTLMLPAQTTKSTAKPSSGTAATSTAAPLDINTATADQLKAISGIGDAYAARIIAGRPYTAKNQLATRGVLPAAVYNKIKDQIVATQPKKK